MRKRRGSESIGGDAMKEGRGKKGAESEKSKMEEGRRWRRMRKQSEEEAEGRRWRERRRQKVGEKMGICGGGGDE